jgi:two-component system nitrogen regulation sensor histidine kinase GlnL
LGTEARLTREISQILDALLDGVVVADGDGRIERLNAEASRILETSTEAVAGRPIEQVTGANGFAKEVRAVLAGAPATVLHEIRVPRRFQGAVLVDAAVAPLCDARGHTEGAVIGLRDRTLGAALRDLERERADAATLGQIASGIAHEVRNPLGGIRGAAELVGKRAASDRDRAACELIVREVDRIAALLDDFLVFGRAGEVKLAAVNLHQVLDDVLDVLAADPLGARARVDRVFDPSIPELFADGDRLVQVFLNLGRNALEAIGERDGHVTITTRLRLDARVDVGGERVPTVAVDFEDTGCGIPDSVRARIATPFFSTKPRGTGLGLALARHFVAQHGGTLQIESHEGIGTRVRVALPLRRPPAVAEPAPERTA